MSRERLLITGATGLVGSRCVNYLTSQGHEVTALARNLDTLPLLPKNTSYQMCDLHNPKEVDSIIAKSDPDKIIHFAAYFPSVDKIEEERYLGEESTAWGLNIQMCKNLAEVAQRYGKHLMFSSTSYVFDGENGPYSEEDIPIDNNPRLSFYGQIKLACEKAVQDNCGNHSMVRFEIPFRPDDYPRLDFARWILKMHQQQELPPMFNNQIITPILIGELAEAIVHILNSDSKGIFHVGPSNLTTPYDFAKELLTQFHGNNPQIAGIPYEQSSGKAPRPVNGGLISRRITALNYQPKTTREMIASFSSESTQNLG